MKARIPLILLLLLLAAGCSGGQEPAGAGASDAPDPSPAASARVTPAPSLPPAPSPAPPPYDYAAPVPESPAVEDSWFGDAVFIGDSRTDGLRLYSGIRGADFLCYKGLTVFEVMDGKPVISAENGKIGVLQALGQKEYAKIYLMLGINELGYFNDQSFEDTYRAAVGALKQAKPGADIYLQSLVPVNEEVCRQTGQPAYINNEKIAAYNAIIEAVAAEQQVYFVDVREALTDESGVLPAEESADGIHFHREGYRAWYEYLKTHTVEEETP